MNAQGCATVSSSRFASPLYLGRFVMGTLTTLYADSGEVEGSKWES